MTIVVAVLVVWVVVGAIVASILGRHLRGRS